MTDTCCRCRVVKPCFASLHMPCMPAPPTGYCLLQTSRGTAHAQWSVLPCPFSSALHHTPAVSRNPTPALSSLLHWSVCLDTLLSGVLSCAAARLPPRLCTWEAHPLSCRVPGNGTFLQTQLGALRSPIHSSTHNPAAHLCSPGAFLYLQSCGTICPITSMFCPAPGTQPPTQHCPPHHYYSVLRWNRAGQPSIPHTRPGALLQGVPGHSAQNHHGCL